MKKPKLSDELPDELYPKLNNEQIARSSQVGTRRSVPAGEILFDQGTRRRVVPRCDADASRTGSASSALAQHSDDPRNISLYHLRENPSAATRQLPSEMVAELDSIDANSARPQEDGVVNSCWTGICRRRAKDASGLIATSLNTLREQVEKLFEAAVSSPSASRLRGLQPEPPPSPSVAGA
jgi:hypothetical protein